MHDRELLTLVEIRHLNLHDRMAMSGSMRGFDFIFCRNVLDLFRTIYREKR